MKAEKESLNLKMGCFWGRSKICCWYFFRVLVLSWRYFVVKSLLTKSNVWNIFFPKLMAFRNLSGWGLRYGHVVRFRGGHYPSRDTSALPPGWLMTCWSSGLPLKCWGPHPIGNSGISYAASRGIVAIHFFIKRHLLERTNEIIYSLFIKGICSQPSPSTGFPTTLDRAQYNAVYS